jgi:hypothetical protein
MIPTVNVHCARCRRALRLPETALGKSLRCPRCGMVFTAKQKPPEVSSWVNYPIERPEPIEKPAPKPPGKSAAPPAPPAPASEDPSDILGVLDTPDGAPPSSQRVVSVQEVGGEQPGGWEPAQSEEAAGGQEENYASEEPAFGVPKTSDTSSDVFAAYTREQKQKAPQHEHEHAHQPEHEPETPLSEMAEAPVSEPEETAAGMPAHESSEGSEQPAEDGTYAFAPEDDSSGSNAKRAMAWFVGGMILGGLSAGGLGTLVIMKIIVI